MFAQIFTYSWAIASQFFKIYLIRTEEQNKSSQKH